MEVKYNIKKGFLHLCDREYNFLKLQILRLFLSVITKKLDAIEGFDQNLFF